MAGVPAFTREQLEGDAPITDDQVQAADRYFLKATGPEIGEVLASWPLAILGVDPKDGVPDHVVAGTIGAIGEMLEWLVEEYNIDADQFNMVWTTLASGDERVCLTAADCPTVDGVPEG